MLDEIEHILVSKLWFWARILDREPKMQFTTFEMSVVRPTRADTTANTMGGRPDTTEVSKLSVVDKLESNGDTVFNSKSHTSVLIVAPICPMTTFRLPIKL